jgi:CPA2 family monovalent cation:H+ antiporter-2
VSLFTLALGYAMLPPLPFLAVIVPALLLVGYFLRGPFNAMYFHGKSALAETLAETPKPAEPVTGPEIQARLLGEVGLESLTLAPGMPGAGKSLRELELKTRTGAWVVGIERESREIVNPDADEILIPGDRLLIVGNGERLAAARGVLRGAEHPTGGAPSQ